MTASELRIQLNDRVSGLGQGLKALAVDVRELDRRLIRVETALELASTGNLLPCRPPKKRRMTAEAEGLLG